jgi:signal transduction histidine kinase
MSSSVSNFAMAETQATAQPPISVLLVEDDHDDYLLTRDLFATLPAGGYTLDRVATYDEAVEALARCAHEVYLVDYRLGLRTGLDLVAHARASGCTAPMIMLTGQHERQVDLSAMEAGADDYIPKDRLDADTLERSMRYALARKKLEDEIRQHSVRLDQRVRERTAELNRLNEALHAEVAERKRAEQALRDADRRKDEFLATLAHELRNPLAPLSAAIQLIAAEPGRSEQVKPLVGMMQQQLDQLVRLIDDLVDVSRITSGKLRLRREPASLAEFIKAAVDQSRPLIESSRHKLHVRLPSEPLVVSGDKVRLAQIISNLLINAAKYTPPAGQIDLTAEQEAGDVVIRARDNGIGIPPEMQSRIFELFAQVDSSSTRSHGGLGIGLTIVKTLVEMHGGKISAASEGRGKGSEFIVRLPLAGVETTSQAGKSDGDSQMPPASRILIVDDNQSAAHLMSRLLQKLGQNVEVVDSGPAALSRLADFAPEIVISDVAMPGMSGYDLARRIRGLDLPNQPYLVAVTGYGQDSDRQEALAAGFDKHLTKPVGVGTLAQLVRDIGGRR